MLSTTILFDQGMRGRARQKVKASEGRGIVGSVGGGG